MPALFRGLSTALIGVPDLDLMNKGCRMIEPPSTNITDGAGDSENDFKNGGWAMVEGSHGFLG